MPPKARRQYGTGSIYQRSSDGRWMGALVVGVTRDGKPRRVTVSAATEAAAKTKLKTLEAKVAAEGPSIAGVSSLATVSTWSSTWLKTSERTVRPKTWLTNRSCIELWIVPTIGKVRLDNLTPAHVRAVVHAIEAAGRAPATARRAHVVLNKMLRDATVEGHMVAPRVLLTTGPMAGANDRDAIDLEDALALLKASTRDPDAARWVAALLQGMRQGECLGLTWDAIDFDKGTLDVSWQLQPLPYLDRAAGTFRMPRGYEVRHLWKAFHLVRPKTSKGYRIIPLVPWMVAALRDWREAAPPSPFGLVWPRADGMPRSAKEDRAEWARLQDRAKVARVDGTQGRRYVVHEARHTTATLLLEAGISDAVVTAILGHTTIKTSRGYQHVADQLRRDAMEQVAARFGLIEAGKD